MSQLKVNPRVRRQLEDLGYTPEQIPDWVVASTAPSSLGETPAPAGAPRVGGATRVVQIGSQVGKWSSSTPSGTSNPPTGPMEGVEGGMRAPMGSYNRVARARSLAR
jgi:hypothetical protein